MQHFDIVAIASIIDWFNVMTYDLHGLYFVCSAVHTIANRR